jgi:hypothetical protein
MHPVTLSFCALVSLVTVMSETELRAGTRVAEPENLKTVPVTTFYLIPVPAPGHIHAYTVHCTYTYTYLCMS